MRSTTLIQGERIMFRTESSDFLDFLEQRGHPANFNDVQVALFSRRNGPEMDAVGIFLLRADVPYIRLNSDELLAGPSCRMTYDAGNGQLSIIQGSIKAKPTVAVFHLFDMSIYPHEMSADSAASWHYAREAWHSISCSLADSDSSSGIELINSPAVVQRLTRLQQMRIAALCGLSSPKSAVVSDVRDAYDILGVRRVIVKPVREHFIELSMGDENRNVLFGVFPQVVDWPSTIGNPGSHDPVLVQEFIPHESELRVYAFRGDEPLALELRSKKGAFSTPYSATGGVEVDVASAAMPESLTNSISQFMDISNLDYGAFDFVRDGKSGELVFLEVNTSGGWRCYERILGTTEITRRFAKRILSSVMD